MSYTGLGTNYTEDTGLGTDDYGHERRGNTRHRPDNTVLHILFYSLFFLLIFILFLPIFIYILLLCFIFLHCPLSGPFLIYISLLIISCIIKYVTNKITLNLAVEVLHSYFMLTHVIN